MITIDFRLAGANFRTAEDKAILDTLLVGDIVHLQPEFSNRFDENAVRVLFKGAHIGYVPKTENPPIAQWFREQGEAGDGLTLSATVIAFAGSQHFPVISLTDPEFTGG